MNYFLSWKLYINNCWAITENAEYIISDFTTLNTRNIMNTRNVTQRKLGIFEEVIEGLFLLSLFKFYIRPEGLRNNKKHSKNYNRT